MFYNLDCNRISISSNEVLCPRILDAFLNITVLTRNDTTYIPCSSIFNTKEKHEDISRNILIYYNSI